jgi:Probable lipoprotein LpqN
VRRFAPAAAALAVLTASAAAGCTPKPPDYQAIWTKSSTATTTTPAGKPEPFSKYLDSIGVTGETVDPNALPDLTVSIPTPPGWTPYTNPKINPNTKVIAKGGKYPTAMLMAFRLRGANFDPVDAIKHGNADAQMLENYRQLDASDANFNGFPSSMIQGSYDAEGTRLHSYNRVVLATGSPPAKQRYMVQLTVTSLANEAVTQSSGIETVISGLVVAAK